MVTADDGCGNVKLRGRQKNLTAAAPRYARSKAIVITTRSMTFATARVTRPDREPCHGWTWTGRSGATGGSLCATTMISRRPGRAAPEPALTAAAGADAGDRPSGRPLDRPRSPGCGLREPH